jgi:hypothetical protein
MHLQSNRAVGATVFTVDSVTNVPNFFIATAGTLLPTGFIDPSTKTDFFGHVSGATLILDALCPGSADTGNTSGQVVVIKPNSEWANLVAQFVKNASGNGTPENMTAATLTANDLETATMKATGTVEFDGLVKVVGASYSVAQSVASVDASGNITPNAQVFRVTALAANATVQVPSFAAQDGMTGELRLSDNGTGRTLTWAAGWKPIGLTLPTTTNGYAFTYVSYEYSASDSKWHVTGVARA